jgi:SAM-dependent methyltransferase
VGTEAALEKFAGRFPAKSGRALVVGSKCYEGKQDRRLLYGRAIGVDLFGGEGVDVVHDLENPLPGSLGRFDHVDCVSVLEHVRRPWLLAANVEVVMKRGATILVSVPFVWRVHAYPSDYWRLTAEALEVLFPNIRWLSKRYLVNGRARKVVPGKLDGTGQWMARAELVAAGVKCKLTS